jgi:hypothetical protein
MDFLEHTAERLAGALQKQNPECQKVKDEMQKPVKNLKLLSIAGMAGSLAFAALGLPLSVIGVGIPLVMVSLPLGYCSYNLYKVSENMSEIIDNHTEYQPYGGFGNLDIIDNKRVPYQIKVIGGPFDQKKITEKLVKNTIFFEWFVNRFVKEMVKHNFVR